MSAPDFSPNPNDPHLRRRLIPKRAGGGGGAESSPNTEPQEFSPPRAPSDLSKRFFDETVTVPDAFRELLEKYSHVPPGEVDEHVLQLVRNCFPPVHH